MAVGMERAREGVGGGEKGRWETLKKRNDETMAKCNRLGGVKYDFHISGSVIWWMWCLCIKIVGEKRSLGVDILRLKKKKC